MPNEREVRVTLAYLGAVLVATAACAVIAPLFTPIAFIFTAGVGATIVKLLLRRAHPLKEPSDG